MNTLKLDIETLEIGVQEELIQKESNSRFFDYNEAFKTNIVLEPSTGYRNIVFSEITSPSVLIVTSDVPINAKINGVEYTNSYVLLLNTAINSVEVANVSPSKANIKINIWGQQ